MVDPDDWIFNSAHFHKLDHLWGPHSVDRFASYNSTQLPRYCSKWWCLGCEVIDVFTVDRFSSVQAVPFSVLGDLKIRITYHHVDIAPAHQKYLLVVCFLFIVQGALRYLVFAPLLHKFVEKSFWKDPPIIYAWTMALALHLPKPLA